MADRSIISSRFSVRAKNTHTSQRGQRPFLFRPGHGASRLPRPIAPRPTQHSCGPLPARPIVSVTSVSNIIQGVAVRSTASLSTIGYDDLTALGFPTDLAGHSQITNDELQPRIQTHSKERASADEDQVDSVSETRQAIPGGQPSPRSSEPDAVPGVACPVGSATIEGKVHEKFSITFCCMKRLQINDVQNVI